jgi:hypothetical protein
MGKTTLGHQSSLPLPRVDSVRSGNRVAVLPLRGGGPGRRTPQPQPREVADCGQRGQEDQEQVWWSSRAFYPCRPARVRGRNLDTITQVAVIEAFPFLRSDLDRVMAAGTMVEAIDAVAQEGQNSTRLFLLLQRGLKALDIGGGGHDLVSSFLLKLAGVVGVAPALTRCASCGGTDTLDRFSFSGGGVVCRICRSEGTVRLRPGLTDYLAGLAAADLSMLPPTDPIMAGEAMLGE